MGLVGSLLANQSGNTSRDFCMFVAAFAMVTDSFYGLFANFFEPLAVPIVLFVFDFMNVAFTFAAPTVLAVDIGTHSCTNTDYLGSYGLTTQSCRVSKAAVAFFYFTFFLFLAKMILSGLALMTSGQFSSLGGFTPRRKKTAQVGVPTISQV